MQTIVLFGFFTLIWKFLTIIRNRSQWENHFHIIDFFNNSFQFCLYFFSLVYLISTYLLSAYSSFFHKPFLCIFFMFHLLGFVVVLIYGEVDVLSR